METEKVLVNLTPHVIVLRTAAGDIPIEPTVVARVASKPGKLVEEGLPIPVKEPDTFGEVQGLPPPAEGVYYIVSAVVGAQCAGRRDVLVPGTGPGDNPIRENGQVVAITCLKHV
jgi:hypothetical protein